MNLEKIKEYFIPDRILDIGANVGGWYNEAKSVFPEAYILSIEANEECEEVLKLTNPNYKIAFLAKDNEIYKFYKNKDVYGSTGNSIYKELSEHYTEENTYFDEKQGIMLDDGLNGLGIFSYFDLIKMDVQGAELDIIRGGINLCKGAKGILLEVALKEYNQGSPLHDEIVDYMKSIGFKKAEILDNLPYNGEIYHQDILFINENIIHN